MKHSIHTIVFDLDGTLYQNNTFHRDYIHFLLEGSHFQEWEEALVTYIDEVYCGQHLEMNASYRCEVIEAATPEDFFDGLERQRLENSASEQGNSIYLGDGWAVVILIGRALGLLEADRSDRIYHQTRDKMSADGVQGNLRLRKAMEQASRQYTTVLLTNSYRETTEDFLRQLGMEGLFQKVICSAGKPRGMVESLRNCCPELLTQPERVLTIGDNAFNDLMPLQELGCKALWVNPFDSARRVPCDYMVRTLEELAEYLENLCRKSVGSL